MITNKIKIKLLAFFLLLSMGIGNAAVWKLDKTELHAPGSKDTLCLQITDNSFPFTSFQVDIHLPEGLLITGTPVLSSLTNGHTLSWELQDDGGYRCVVYSVNNKEMQTKEGALLYIPVQLTAGFTSGAFSTSNAILVNKQSEGLEIGNFSETLHAHVKEERIVVNVSGLEQIANSEKAASIDYTVFPEEIKQDVQVEYYINEDCSTKATEEQLKKEGIFYVKISYEKSDKYEAYEEIVMMSLTNKKDIREGNIEKPKASAVVKGQQLSFSLLTGGSVQDDGIPVPGVFIWTNGNSSVSTSGEYSVTFIPQNQMYYNTKEIKVEVEAKETCLIVAVGSSGGAVTVKGKTDDNIYVKEQEITLDAIPDINYRFVKWTLNGNPIEKGSRFTVKVSENATYYAVFEPIKHVVTIETEGKGTLNVTDENGISLTSGSEMQQGSILKIKATSAEDSQLSSLIINNDPFNGDKLKLEKETTIRAVFTDLKPNTYEVSVTPSSHGSLFLYKEDGSPIIPGSFVPAGTKIQAIALPDAGYEQASILIEGTKEQDDLYIVEGTVSASATFQVLTYQVEAHAVTSNQKEDHPNVEIKLTKEGDSQTYQNSMRAEYGATVAFEITPKEEGATLLYILANGREISPYDKLVVTGDLTITAVFNCRATIDEKYIMWPHQEYFYNGVSRNFVPFASQTYAGFSFNVQYQRVKDGNGKDVTDGPIGRAINAGEYKVLLSREADGLYNKFDMVYDKGLIIKQSTISVTAAPSSRDENPKTRPTEGVKIEKNASGNLITYQINPDNDLNKNNYKGTTYFYSTNPEQSIKIGNHSLLRSSQKGYVRITNGGLPYEEINEGIVQIHEGITVSIEAIPSNGYKFVKWGDGDNQNPRQFTITANAPDLTPVFEPKLELPVTGLSSNQSVYDGDSKTVSVVGIGEEVAKTCQILFFADEACTQLAELKNAGKYYIQVFRSEDATYKAYNHIFTYTITPVEPQLAKLKASDILAGQTLSNAELMGGDAGAAKGSFAWTEAGKKITKTGNFEVTFTPEDPNYTPATTLVKVNVLSLRSGEDTPGGSDDSNVPDDPTNPDGPDTPDDPDTPDTPTEVESIEGQTVVIAADQTIIIHPVQPISVSVVNAAGGVVYAENINRSTRIPVGQAGIYLIRINAGGTVTTQKILVR